MMRLVAFVLDEPTLGMLALLLALVALFLLSGFVLIKGAIDLFLPIFTNWNWRHRRFKKRQELSLNELYDKYFSDTSVEREVFVALWRIAADKLELPAGRLRPTDRFKKELKFLELGGENEIGKFRYTMKRIALYYNLHINSRDIKSLGDYIKAFGSIQLNQENDAEVVTMSPSCRKDLKAYFFNLNLEAIAYMLYVPMIIVIVLLYLLGLDLNKYGIIIIGVGIAWYVLLRIGSFINTKHFRT